MTKGSLAAHLDSMIRAVRAGETERFGEVVSALEADVRTLLAIMIPDKSRVPDLTHEAFVVAYVKLDEYCEGTDFAAWMKAIARNLASNERRRWIREQRFSARYAAAIEDDIVGPLVDRLTDQLEIRQQAQLLAALRECVAGLKKAARDAVERFYFNGASVADIAMSSGRSPGAIKVILFRARAALAECLAMKGWFTFGRGAQADE